MKKDTQTIMRNFLLIASVSAAVLLAGCGNIDVTTTTHGSSTDSNPEEVTPKEIISQKDWPEEASGDDTVQENEPIIESSENDAKSDNDIFSKSDDEKETQGNTTDNAPIISSYEDVLKYYTVAYNDVLAEICEFLLADEETACANEEYSGIIEVKLYPGVMGALNSIGYTFKDIDSNGIYELLILDTPYSPEENNLYNTIYYIYTLDGAKPIRLADGSPRDRYYLTSDGHIYNQGSSGAAYNIYTLYDIGPDGKSLKVKDCFFTGENETHDAEEYYYSNSDDWDPATATLLDSNSGVFTNTIREWDKSIISMEATSLMYYLHN